MGRRIEKSTVEGADFTDPAVGPISLKGPLVNKSTGAPIPINDKMVDGLGKSVVKDVQNNTYTKRVVVDTAGLSSEQRNRLKSTIEAGLAKKPGASGKDIVFVD